MKSLLYYLSPAQVRRGVRETLLGLWNPAGVNPLPGGKCMIFISKCYKGEGYQESLAFFLRRRKAGKKRAKLNIYPETEVEKLYHWFINLSLPTYPKAKYFYFLRSCNKLVCVSSTVFTYILNKVLNKESITSSLWQKNKKDRHYVLFSKNATVQLRYLTAV